MSKPYQICVKGHLDGRWACWFDDLTIERAYDAENAPITLLTGPVVDQSALYGIVNRLRDLGVTLISVQQIEE